MKISTTPLKAALLAALLGTAGTAGAQQYGTPNTAEFVLQQILDQVIGSRYTYNNTYRDARQQELFRRADTNRDGYLTQQEVDAYRARMGYSRYYDRDRDYRHGDRGRYNRGVPTSQVDTNRDGYISRSEAAEFVRDVQREGLDDYYDRRDRNDWRR